MRKNKITGQKFEGTLDSEFFLEILTNKNFQNPLLTRRSAPSPEVEILSAENFPKKIKKGFFQRLFKK